MTTRFTLNVTSDEMGANGSGMSQNATVSSDNPQDLLSALTQLAGVNRASNNYGMQAYGQEAEQGQEHECNECGYMESKCQCEDEVAEEFANSATEPKSGAQVYSAAGGVGDIAYAGQPARAKTRYTPANSGDNPLVNENMLGDLGASLMREWQETKLQGVSDEFDAKVAMKAIAEGKTEYRHGSKQFAIRTDNNIIKVFPILENHTLLTMPLLALEASSIVNTQTEGNFTEGSRIAEGTMAHGIFASNAREAQDAMTQLADLLQNPLSAAEAQDLLGDLVFDDQLFDAISDAEDQDPDMDLRQDSKFMGRLEELKSWAQKELEGMSEGQINEIGDTPGGMEKLKAYRATVGRQAHKTGEYDVRNSDRKPSPYDAKTKAQFPANKQANRAAGAARAKKIELAKSQGATYPTTEGVTEDYGSVEAVASAVTNRIMRQHVDLLSKYGPVKVMAAIDDVAEYAGMDELDEIGSSDVSGWVKQVVDGLESGHFNNVDEGVAEGLHPMVIDDVKKLATLNPVDRYSAYGNIRGYFKADPALSKMASDLMGGYYEADMLRGKYKTAEAKVKYDELEPIHQAFIKQALGQEQGVAESVNVSPEVAQVLAQCGSDELNCYDVMYSPKTPAQQQASKIIQDMYDDVSIDHHLHADDDVEQILDIVADHLAQDYGTNEGAHTNTIAAMADSAYQPKVGDKIRTRKGGQIPGTVEKVGDQDGIDYCWFRHPEGKMYKTPCSNVMREDMDEAMEPWMGKDTDRPAIVRKKEHENGKPAHTDVGDRFRNPGSNNPAFQRKKYVPEPKKENIEMNEELAQIMALAGMHEAKVDEQDVDENAYNQAAAEASRSGAKEFEFPKGSGKMHPAKMDKDTAHQIGEAQSPAQKAAFAAMIAKKSGDKPKAKDDDKKSDDNKKPDDDGDGIPNWVKGESANMDEDFTDMLALAGLSEKKDPEDEAKMDEASHQAATTMKHVKNPTQGEIDAAKKIKPGIPGIQDRFDMLKSAEKDGRLNNESTIAEDEELAYVKHLLNKWL
jgi:hypothetical protein